MDKGIELCRKYRPRKFSEVVGQQEALTTLAALLKRNAVPHVLLFLGPSGCGKTTLARIMARRLRCAKVDFCEVNAANSRGVDMVRGIQRRAGLAPMGGDCRVWLIDEAHQLTGEAQGAFLKLLEDTPGHVYFFLATTDPRKLKRTIITRSTEIKVSLLSALQLQGLLERVVAAERGEVGEAVRDRIVDLAEGSARKALVLLHQVIGMEDEEGQLEALVAADVERQAVEICRLLLNPRTRWPAMAAALKGVDEEPESLRRMVLGYMDKVLLGGGKSAADAVAIIESFRDNFYDCGKAGLDAACWESLGGEGK